MVTGKGWTPKAEAEWRQSIIDFYGDGADEELFCVPSLSSGAWLPAPLIEARMTATRPVLRLELPQDYLYRSRGADVAAAALPGRPEGPARQPRPCTPVLCLRVRLRSRL